MSISMSNIQITKTSSYYDALDLSDISEFEDPMTTSSDEDIPALEVVGY